MYNTFDTYQAEIEYRSNRARRARPRRSSSTSRADESRLPNERSASTPTRSPASAWAALWIDRAISRGGRAFAVSSPRSLPAAWSAPI